MLRKLKAELKPLVKEGVVGFKCFLIHSGVDEFPCVDEGQVDLALKQLEGTGSLLAVSHASPVLA